MISSGIEKKRALFLMQIPPEGRVSHFLTIRRTPAFESRTSTLPFKMSMAASIVVALAFNLLTLPIRELWASRLESLDSRVR